MFSPAALELLPVFLAERKDEPLVARDAPGNFVRYLSSKVGMPCRYSLIVSMTRRIGRA